MKNGVHHSDKNITVMFLPMIHVVGDALHYTKRSRVHTRVNETFGVYTADNTAEKMCSLQY